MEAAASRHAIPPCIASARVTAGLKCAPEIGPNARIRATSAVPVATAFASSATATLPPANRSPMMPEPTTAISRKAVPNASVAARRTTASLLCADGFDGADERAHEFSIYLRRKRVDIDSLPRQKFAGIFRAVDACRLKSNLLKSGAAQLAAILALLQRSGDAAHPRQHALPNLRRHFAASHYIGHGEASA